MKTLLLLAIPLVIILTGAILAHQCSRQKRRGTLHDYGKRQPLTNGEQAMYWRLVKTLPEHVILAQVAMSSCVRASGPAFGTIAQKSLDFVVCNKDLEIIAAIELDDRTHARPGRKKSDQVKDDALEKAGIRLIRWPAARLPDVSEILNTFSHPDTILSARKAMPN